MIDLDQLLTGNPTWKQVVDFWKNEGFDDEQYLVAAIKRWLRTENHKSILYFLDLSIEDILNGRYGMKEHEAVYSIYEDWNKELGYRAFGS